MSADSDDDVALDAVRRLFAALAARDLDAVVGCFTPDARYGNVPHPPATGRDAIRAMLAPLVQRSTSVRWDVVTVAVTGHHVIAERVDRFVVDDEEYAVPCCGVFVVDPGSGLVSEVRDYVDLGPWRERTAGLLARPVDA